MYPEEFDKLIELFEKLPGVGSRSAQRYAFRLLDRKEDINNIVDVLKNVDKIKKCPECGFITNKDKCLICSDDSRDHSTIMVVAQNQDVVAIEKTEQYHGLYHVLGGLISSSNGIFPSDLNLDSLIKRVNNNTQEIIISTPSTTDGEITTIYILKLLKGKNLKITRLAKGMPIGTSLDYADEQTLSEALINRKEVKEK